MYRTSNPAGRIQMTELVGWLEDHFGVTCPLNTRQLRDLATNRKIPARKIDGTWSIAEEDGPAVADILGMSASATAA